MSLSPTQYYHIFNRANGWEKIFLREENYRYFIQQYQLYLGLYVDTYCYCLMPNHFHLLIRVKDEKDLPTHQQQNLQGLGSAAGRQNLEGLSPQPTPETILSNQFSRFFNSYAKAFNKENKRKGSLFMKNFKRKQVNDMGYLKKLVHYIHFNPVEAGLCQSPNEWVYSSYNGIAENKNSLINIEIMEWFDGLDGFKTFHHSIPELKEAK